MAAAANAAEPDWDLRPYFTALGADDYTRFRAQLERDLGELETRVRALGAPDALRDERAAWVALLLDVEDAEARFGHLASFLGCFCAANSADEAGQREEASLATLGALASQVALRIRAAFGAASESSAFDDLVSDPALDDVRYHLERVRQDAERSMSAELESLSADLAVDGIEAPGADSTTASRGT